MRISKIINNNVVSIWDDEGREIITTGRGVGFKAREGSSIDDERVEKVSRPNNQGTMDKSKELLVNLPMEYIRVSAEIISYAEGVLNRPADPNMYIILTDHINFTLECFKQKMMFTNPLIRGVRSFYREEYLMGEYAIAVTDRDLRVKLSMDETASTAPHTVNVEYDAPMGDTIRIINLIQQVPGVMKGYFNIKLGEQSLSYERLITYLRFLAQRVFTGGYMDLDNLKSQKVIDRLYPEEYVYSQKVRELTKGQYGYQVTEEEVAHLALRIKHIRTK